MTEPASPPRTLPVLCTRREVVLPGVVLPLEVGRRPSLAAVDAAVASDSRILLVPQRDPGVDNPALGDLVEVGVVAEILQVARHAPKRYMVLVRADQRVALGDVQVADSGLMTASFEPLTTLVPPETQLVEAMTEVRADLGAILLEQSDTAEGQVRARLEAVVDPDELIDLAIGHLELEHDQAVALLTEVDVAARFAAVRPALRRMREVLERKAAIRTELADEISTEEREKVLRSRLRDIARELGEPDDEGDLSEYADRIASSGMTDEVKKVARKQVARMRQAGASSPEHSVARTYLEWLLDLPWGVRTEDRFDVAAARAILEADHAGLDKVKRRILEFIAVRKLAPDRPGPILCLVGPPGVGKTSLGRSIASALGRKYVRVSLGGVRDDAEIRGHRRTYVGALPGRIVSGLKKAGSMNPVFVLDEIDKLASDRGGDPGSALLEVLDPKQNYEFVDHYLEVPVDLSQIAFVCTANSLETIPPALLDRLEVVQIAGYTESEKCAIARRHLIPRQLAEHGLGGDAVSISDDAVSEIIGHYTREAGVRNLERELAALCRHAAVVIAGATATKPLALTRREIDGILGPRRFETELADHRPMVGVATGLGWTPVGGDLLFIEARQMPGTGQFKLTGQVGDVMAESAQAALSYVRANAARLGIGAIDLSKIDLHLHMPEGATRKDGPSAGLALTLALVSLLSERPLRPEVAMTGEISLRGLVLPVGGIKSKVLAAHRAGSKVVLLPARNQADLAEIPAEVRRDLELRLVSRIDEAIELAIARDGAPVEAAASEPDPAEVAVPPATPGKRRTTRPPPRA